LLRAARNARHTPETYKDSTLQPEFRGDWDKFHMLALCVQVDETVIRAYSMGQHPKSVAWSSSSLRVQSPPPGRDDLPPGKMSSWALL